MASNLRVDTILPSSGTTLGIGTASGTINFLGNSNLTTTGDVTVGGNLGVGGTLTYEDVTNIDSVGVITARSGLRVPAGEISLGTGTPRQKLHINASDSGASNMVFTNATTGTAAGDGFVVGITGGEDAQLNMQESANLKFSTADTERLRIGSAGQIGIAGANYGTSGQVLTSQGNSSAPTWATPSGGLFASYAQVCDRKSSGSHGGSFSSGDWRTRELNTEAFDPDGIVTLSSNQFTLQAGSYFINAMAPAQSVVNHQLRLRNITDSNNALFGFSAYASQSSGNATDDNDYAFLKGRITLSGAKTFELQHRCNTTRNGAGFGQPTGYAEETYASVEIYKEN